MMLADWALVEDAVVAADFWRLDQSVTLNDLGGLDGATWHIAGRRGPDFHHVRRWSPHGVVYDLGRLMFDLAGLEGFWL